MHSNWKNITVANEATIKDAMRLLNSWGMRIVLVADGNSKLLGTITDGDIRRGLLQNLTLDSPVYEIMNNNPLYSYLDQDRGHIRHLLNQHSVLAMPIVDRDHKIVDIESIDSLSHERHVDVDVVLMAGGLGKRLYPLTKETPKPMLHIDSKPILQTIIEDFVHQGFNRFHISTFYKADKIRDHFKDGTGLGCSISYVHESTPLGTAGALSFLRSTITKPFIVINADLVVKVNFQTLLDFHSQHSSIATMCVRQSHYQIPYGVVEMNGSVIKDIKEKPSYSHFVNAGIYCFNPDVFDHIEDEQYLDMPTLFQNLIEKKKELMAFPIHEYWVDIGHMDEYQKLLAGFINE